MEISPMPSAYTCGLLSTVEISESNCRPNVHVRRMAWTCLVAMAVALQDVLLAAAIPGSGDGEEGGGRGERGGGRRDC